MTKFFFVLFSVVMLVFAFFIAEAAFAQDAFPDRVKSGPRLDETLNGADKFVVTIQHHMDGGTAPPAICGLVGTGINAMIWCDGEGYFMTSPNSVPLAIDGGVNPTHEEMVPIDRKEKYGIGLLGRTESYVCIKQTANQPDGGVFLRCNIFRRF